MFAVLEIMFALSKSDFFFFFLEMQKKVRVGGFKLGSVGEPETQLFIFCL